VREAVLRGRGVRPADRNDVARRRSAQASLPLAVNVAVGRRKDPLGNGQNVTGTFPVEGLLKEGLRTGTYPAEGVLKEGLRTGTYPAEGVLKEGIRTGIRTQKGFGSSVNYSTGEGRLQKATRGEIERAKGAPSPKGDRWVQRADVARRRFPEGSRVRPASTVAGRRRESKRCRGEEGIGSGTGLQADRQGAIPSPS
jgi:hypothetical protein